MKDAKRAKKGATKAILRSDVLPSAKSKPQGATGSKAAASASTSSELQACDCSWTGARGPMCRNQIDDGSRCWAKCCPFRPPRFGNWTLDVYQREIIDKDNVAVALSAAEYRLLQVFLQRPQRTLSRDQLLDLTHGREAKAYDRSIDNLISRLRRKVEVDTTNPKIIKTVRGGGYTLAIPVTKKFKNA